jgi:hypothetical protein
MKLYTLLAFMLLQFAYAYAQEANEEIEHFCSNHCDSIEEFVPLDPPGGISNNINCGLSSASDYAQLSPSRLFDALLASHEPQACVYRLLVSFNTVESPKIFSNERVRTVALLSEVYFSTFDGINDNGSLALMTYLGLAVQFSADFSHIISFAPDTWDAIEQSLLVYHNNPIDKIQSETALFTTSHFLNASARDSLNSEVEIITFVGNLLDDLAADGYSDLDDIYPYYFCYYYLLDIYFRYAPLNQNFLSELENHTTVIASLEEVATNTNLNTETFSHFDDLSNFSVTGLVNMINHEPVETYVIEALNEVNNTYESFSPQWLTAAFQLAEHDENFEYSFESLTAELRTITLPNTHTFDEGRFIIETSLSYEEALALYEASQEVRAQFFRLIGDHSVVPQDQNDTVTAVVYGTRQDYVDFNNLLYGINFPNSGGVYIELFGTFFTYDRGPHESQFTLEELFRHEYIHYLQGRYLIPGDWGVAEVYQNSRLVWLEEGMAQFLTGSMRTDGIGLLEVTRTRVKNHGVIQGFDQIFTSSYGSGNALAYYDFSPLLWHYWYENDQELIDELLTNLKQVNLPVFDSLINSVLHDTTQEQAYIDYINTNIIQDSLWFSPVTAGVDYSTLNSLDLDGVIADIETINPRFEAQSSTTFGDTNQERFRIEGVWHCETDASIETDINDLLIALSSDDKLDPLNFNVAYYAAKDTNGMVSFAIEGPVGRACELPIEDPAIFVDSSFALLFHFSGDYERRNIRIREIGQTEWDYNSASSHNFIDSLLNLTSEVGYEYQIQYVCNESSLSPYTEIMDIYPCHSDRVIAEDIITNQNLYSANNLNANSSITNASKVGFYALNTIELNSGFLVDEGSELEIDHANCLSGEF